MGNYNAKEQFTVQKKAMFLRLPVATITTFMHQLQNSEMYAETALAFSTDVSSSPVLLITFEVQNPTWSMKTKRRSEGNTSPSFLYWVT